jgi:hypothetical protein
MNELSKETERELAGLADDSLTAKERERALERVQASRDLQSALAEQRHAVELISAVEVQAPATLHRRIETMLAPAPSRRRFAPSRRRFAAPRVGFAAAFVAVALALAAVAVGLSERGSSGIGVQQAAALTLSRATMPAPTESRSNRTQLTVSVGGVSFPYWRERFGWSSSGARSDRLAGRSVTTVFYTNSTGRRIGYAIVSGNAPSISDGTLVRHWGVSYRILNHDGAAVLTWQRAGHLCVMSGRDVSTQTLLRLAGWDGQKSLSA